MAARSVFSVTFHREMLEALGGWLVEGTFLSEGI